MAAITRPESNPLDYLTQRAEELYGKAPERFRRPPLAYMVQYI
jgi:hypothetical protein